MQTNTMSHDDIHYNAAEQTFEARVTLQSPEGARTYACSVAGDLSMSLDQAAQALRVAALTRHAAAPGLYSAQAAQRPVPLRAPARPSWRKRLLRALPRLAMPRAA